VKKDTVKLINVTALLMVTWFMPAPGHSGDIDLLFGRTHSVTVAKARIVAQSEKRFVLAGQLYRPHRLPMAGHLHVYAYLKDGDLVSDSRHRVLGLNSQRGGSMRVPFRVSIPAVAETIDRVYLEYHSPGSSEL